MAEPIRRSRWPAVLGSLLLVAALGCSPAAPAPNNRNSGPAAVAVARVERHDLAREVVLSAPVEPIRTVGVNSRASGTMLTVRVVEGDRVRPGQLMAELDARETAAQLARARAVLANAKASFDRTEKMHASRIVTDAELEQARAAYATAQSDVDLWETRLDFTRVEAPTAGTVTAKLIEAGGAVTTNQHLFDIADDSLLVVRVQMSELDVVHVKVGSRATVQLDALPDANLTGTVRRVFPAANAQTRLVPVEVALGRSSGGPRVRPGFLARIHFDLEQRGQAIAVPAAALGASASGPFVYVVQADTLVRRPVSTGMTSAGLVEVAEGLTPGELVVTSGQVNLRQGAKVRITAGPEPADSGLRLEGEAAR
jgi:membrane fusion protein, multidrug efflux system